MEKEQNNPNFGPGNTENQMNSETTQGFISDEDLASLVWEVQKEYVKCEEGIVIEWSNMGSESFTELRRRNWLSRVLNRLEKKPITRSLAERIMDECHLAIADSLRPKTPTVAKFNDHQRKIHEKLDAVYEKIRSTQNDADALLLNRIPLEFEEEVNDLRFQAIEAGLSREEIGDSDFIRYFFPLAEKLDLLEE